MFSIFSPDSRLMQIISRFADLAVLNLLFLLTSLPIFTVGAANAAMYTVTFRILRQREEPLVKSYFRAFLANFRQGTALWLLFLLVTLPALFYIHRFFSLEGAMHYLFLPFLTVFIMSVFLFSWVFPWISQFRNTTGQALRNALLLSLANLPRTMAVAAIHLLPPGLLLFDFALFLRVSFLWVALYFSAAAYMSTAILWKVFRSYYSEEA